ncbi:30S ribosomal protein S3 [Patescibacteria group bacterium]|nr:MAG: 30S ribosomal protein S3 [Patescibacteria group bacterium]
MTKIVHPYAHRIGILRDWQSRWFAGNAKKNREFIRTDARVREFLIKRLRGAYVSHVEIERSQKDLRVQIHTARPGMVIGRSGEGATKLKKDIASLLKKLGLVEVPALHLDVIEVRSPESNAAIVSAMVVEGLEKRLPFRRVMKQTIDKVMANRDVQGVRIAISGMLGSGSMSRVEELKKGRIPLQTFRADIDYAQIAANMPLGKVGVKVWIYKGDVFADDPTRLKV